MVYFSGCVLSATHVQAQQRRTLRMSVPRKPVGDEGMACEQIAKVKLAGLLEWECRQPPGPHPHPLGAGKSIRLPSCGRKH